MNLPDVQLVVTFTSDTLSRHPHLQALNVGLTPAGSAAFVTSILRGDQIELQGAPIDGCFTVVSRLWKVSEDSVTLTLLLDAQELAA